MRRLEEEWLVVVAEFFYVTSSSRVCAVCFCCFKVLCRVDVVLS